MQKMEKRTKTQPTVCSKQNKKHRKHAHDDNQLKKVFYIYTPCHTRHMFIFEKLLIRSSRL